MIKKCLGCGVVLQTENKEIEGYVRESVYEKSFYCERCFRAIHYGEVKKIVKDNQFIDFIDGIDIDIPVIYIVDLTCFSNLIALPLKFIKNEVYLVLTKRDLIPKSVKDSKLISYFKEFFPNVQGIHIVSGKKLWRVDHLYNFLVRKKIKKCYFLGYTNSGKSTLINGLLKYQGKNAFVTTSQCPNTTLELINIDLDGVTVIDTPGFLNDKSIVNYMDIEDYKRIVSVKEIKPKIYYLKPKFMIIIDKFLRIENQSDEVLGFVFYLRNDLIYRKMKISTSDFLRDKETVVLDIKNDEDIVIEGLGFIKVLENSNIFIYTLNKDIISKRSKMI